MVPHILLEMRNSISIEKQQSDGLSRSMSYCQRQVIQASSVIWCLLLFCKRFSPVLQKCPQNSQHFGKKKKKLKKNLYTDKKLQSHSCLLNVHFIHFWIFQRATAKQACRMFRMLRPDVCVAATSHFLATLLSKFYDWLYPVPHFLLLGKNVAQIQASKREFVRFQFCQAHSINDFSAWWQWLSGNVQCSCSVLNTSCFLLLQ